MFFNDLLSANGTPFMYPREKKDHNNTEKTRLQYVTTWCYNNKKIKGGKTKNDVTALRDALI